MRRRAPAGDVEALLGSYPRERPPLSEAHRRIYESEYLANRQGAGLASRISQRLEGWMHREVARSHGGVTLELGAGTLNHLPYEPPRRVYDVVEPFDALVAASPHRDRVRRFYASLEEVPERPAYRRIVSVATLEHMTDLPAELARAGLRLAPGGRFQAGIPSEGGFLWGLAWRLSTGLAYRARTGLDYGVLIRHEHVNQADEILALVGHFFARVRVRRFPLPHPDLSLYAYLEARAPRLERCRDALRRRGGAARSDP